jgi:hypothetical protein
MLKNALNSLVETLGSKGYQNSMVEIQDASANESNTNKEHHSDLDQQSQRDQQEQLADDEAFSAFVGRQHRDRAANEMVG